MTATPRINECEFKEVDLKQGETFKYEYKWNSYLSIVATGPNSKFKISYWYIDRDPTDFEQGWTFAGFVKTKTFIYVVAGVSVVLLILVALIVMMCWFRYQKNKLISKVKLLEGAKKLNKEGL